MFDSVVVVVVVGLVCVCVCGGVLEEVVTVYRIHDWDSDQ